MSQTGFSFAEEDANSGDATGREPKAGCIRIIRVLPSSFLVRVRKSLILRELEDISGLSRALTPLFEP